MLPNYKFADPDSVDVAGTLTGDINVMFQAIITLLMHLHIKNMFLSKKLDAIHDEFYK